MMNGGSIGGGLLGGTRLGTRADRVGWPSLVLNQKASNAGGKIKGQVRPSFSELRSANGAFPNFFMETGSQLVVNEHPMA